MSQTTEPLQDFLDRRSGQTDSFHLGQERRQFSGNIEDLTPQGKELAQAIDSYKSSNQLAIITYDEIVSIIQSIGYAKVEQESTSSAALLYNDRREEYVDENGVTQTRLPQTTAAEEKKSERRQFSSSYEELSPLGQELGRKVDQYKIQHRRRYITCDEILGVIKSLGYAKQI